MPEQQVGPSLIVALNGPKRFPVAITYPDGRTMQCLSREQARDLYKGLGWVLAEMMEQEAQEILSLMPGKAEAPHGNP